MRRLLPFLILAASPALAAGPAPDTTTIIKGGPPGTNVEMPYLMAPMHDANGKLHGYAYIATRLTAGSAAAALQVRDKLAFIQDVWVRDVNATAVATADDATKVDIAGVETRLADDAKKVIGTAKVAFVTVCTVQVSDLHTKQTPIAADATDEAALKIIPKSRCEPEKVSAEKPAK